VWYDQSGRGNNATQSTTTLQPVYNVAGQYVDFAGSKWMNLPASSFPSGNGRYSYVVKHGSVGVDGAVFTFGTVATNQMAGLLVNNNGNYLDYWEYNDFGFGGSGVSGNVVSVTYDQTNRRGYVNNALKGTNGNSNHNLGNANGYLGRRSDGKYYLNGELYSLVTSSAVLSASDRSLLEGCSMCPAGTYQLSTTGTSCLACPSGI